MASGNDGVEGGGGRTTLDTHICRWIVREANKFWKENMIFWPSEKCGPTEGCLAKLSDLSVNSTGLIQARVVFRFPSFCRIDYHRCVWFWGQRHIKQRGQVIFSYPEEQNDCCLYLGISDIGRSVKARIFQLKKYSKIVLVFPPHSFLSIPNQKCKIWPNKCPSAGWTIRDWRPLSSPIWKHPRGPSKTRQLNQSELRDSEAIH
jgi:hypothetical protein